VNYEKDHLFIKHRVNVIIVITDITEHRVKFTWWFYCTEQC